MRATFGNASSTRFFFPFEKKKKSKKRRHTQKNTPRHVSRLEIVYRNSSRELLISRKFNKRQRGTRENE